MGILDKVPSLFGKNPLNKYRKIPSRAMLFTRNQPFAKRDDLIKKITKDKTRISQVGWAGAIRGSYSSREKRKALAEGLFPKEKFGDYVSKKQFQELMRDLETKSKAFKPSMEKFQATQQLNYLKRKTGF